MILQVLLLSFCLLLSLVNQVQSFHLARSLPAEPIGWPDSVNWFCLSRHSDGLFFDSEVSNNGCQIHCIFLVKSNSIYLDHTERFAHNLQDGASCGFNQVCKSGQCVKNETGVDTKDDSLQSALIEVIDAKVPNKDVLSQSDPYVKVYIIEPKESSKVVTTKIGRSQTVYNNNSPYFGEVFRTHKVTKSSYAMFKVFDKDELDSDDFIVTLYAPLQNEQSNGIRKLTFGDHDEYYLKVRISWIPG